LNCLAVDEVFGKEIDFLTKIIMDNLKLIMDNEK